MRIAVIGAGVAGLVAARELQALGHKVDVFEKSRGRGGRIATRRLDWGEADTGAQYFTARDPDFVREIDQWCHSGAAAIWPFTPYKLRKGRLSASPDTTSRYVGTPGMNGVAQLLASNLNIEFNLCIAGIRRQSELWYLVDQKQ